MTEDFIKNYLILKTISPKYIISTVILMYYRPKEYETMVFDHNKTPIDKYTKRYFRKIDAIQGHDELVKKLIK